MKKALLASLTTVALASGSAFAADLPSPAPVYKAPPPPAPVYSWTGFYLGAGGGYGMFDADTTLVADPNGPPLSSTLNNAGRGWLAKFSIGFDYQFTSNIVAGIFADYDPASIKGTASTGFAIGPVDTLGGQQKESAAWAVGARAGWLITPAILTYIDGGFTQARFDALNVQDLGPLGAGVIGNSCGS